MVPRPMGGSVGPPSPHGARPSQAHHKESISAAYYWEAMMWLRVDADFAAYYAQKEILMRLPVNLRHEAVLIIHR